MNNFTQEILYHSVISKTIDALHRESFSKHPILTAFSVFLKVSDVCNISSKDWVPNKSVNKISLHKTT